MLLKYTERRGRIELCMRVQRVGCDYTVFLTGGDVHVGAVALALPECGGGLFEHADSSGTAVLAVPGHREEALARRVAHTLASTLQCRVCVVCGIHFDDITREEIAQVLTLAATLTDRWVARLTSAGADRTQA